MHPINLCWIRCKSLFALIALAVPAASETTDWKLQPLPYNNTGLVVDLGVGLWAYPMPVDADDDGDLDLMVACPDKPSNGVYFFENPSEDPSNEFPIFQPSDRVGDASQYMTINRVNGESVIMSPAKMFRRDSNSKSWDFARPEKVPLHPNIAIPSHARSRANMWRMVDYDGDGDHDVIIGWGDWADLGWDHAYDNRGVWRNGPLHGHVEWIRNDGTDAEPKYAKQPIRLQAGGGDIDVYGWPSPNFEDFDSDGDLDLLCGEFLDRFTYFRNDGTRTQPNYAAGVKLTSRSGEPLKMHLQMITPVAVDWDKDGDMDLIVGDEDGRVALIQHTGQIHQGVPVFEDPVYLQQQADTLKFGALATPFAFDWDNDGDQDIVCGNTAGEIGWFENLGMAESGLPIWAAPVLLTIKRLNETTVPFRIMAGENGSIQGPCEAKWGYTTLSVADWDNDGDGDILYNSIHGRLGLLLNDSGVLQESEFDTGLMELPPVWDWRQSASPTSLTQWRTTPMMVDFDADGDLDLVMLDQEGYLTLRRDFQSAERIFVDEDNQPLHLNPKSCGGSGRVKLTVGDWDRDGRLDVIVNSENARWYRNCEDRDGTIVLKRIGNLTQRDVSGHTASPSICDFNKDGIPDLLIGSENGRIYHIFHEDCITYTDEQLVARKPKPIEAAKFPGFVSEEFIYAKAPFEQCHASTICQTSRGLVTAWFGGTKEGNDDVAIWSSYHDGATWTAPQKFADGVQHTGLRYPCWNPVLYQPPGDGPTLLFFKVGPKPSSWWGEMMVSYDRGRTFKDRRRLPETIDGPVRCKPILLSDQKTLLCGSSTESAGWKVHMELMTLSDGLPAGPIRRIGPIGDGEDFQAIQPTLLQHDDGRLQILCRTQKGVLASSHSSDNGVTWTDLVATELPNPNSGIDALTLSDGRHVLVYNPIGSDKSGWGRRGRLELAISEDGAQWKSIGVLDEESGAEFSYPAIIQSNDGKLHVTYTWKRTRVKHVVIDPNGI